MTGLQARRAMRAWGRLVRRLAGDRGGNVAVIFGLTLTPITLGSFMAVDLQRMSAAKVMLQDALDAATLQAAKSTAKTDADLAVIGRNNLNANLINQVNMTLGSSSFVENTDGEVVGAATATLKPLIAGMFTTKLTVSADAEVARAKTKLEIALVLDNTGSMLESSGGVSKLARLKTAAVAMVDDLMAAGKNSVETDPVKIGLVPFSSTVNIGASYRGQAWLTGTQPLAYGSDIFTLPTNRFAVFDSLRSGGKAVPWGGCIESRPQPYDVQETAPSVATGGTMFVPYFSPDEPDTKKKDRWGRDTSEDVYINNYLDDASTSSDWKLRQGNPLKYSLKTLRSGDTDVGFTYGPNSGCELQPLIRLTTNSTSIKNAISSMVAVGETHIPIGLMWGWHLITPNAPFSDGSAYGTRGVQKIAILMTDGENTYMDPNTENESLYDGYGYIWQNRLGITSGGTTTRTTAMNNRLALLCKNMKDKKIVIYAVRVEVDANDNGVLKACASGDDKFFEVSDSAKLGEAFDAIATSIQSLRITH